MTREKFHKKINNYLLSATLGQNAQYQARGRGNVFFFSAFANSSGFPAVSGYAWQSIIAVSWVVFLQVIACDSLQGLFISLVLVRTGAMKNTVEHLPLAPVLVLARSDTRMETETGIWLWVSVPVRFPASLRSGPDLNTWDLMLHLYGFVAQTIISIVRYGEWWNVEKIQALTVRDTAQHTRFKAHNTQHRMVSGSLFLWDTSS